MGEGDVAGILQSLGCLLRAMALTAPAVEQLTSSGDLFRAAAVEGGVQINGSAVQRRRHGQHLEGGARLIAVGHTAVSPLLQPSRVQGLLVGLRVPFQGFQLCGGFFIINFQIVVGVIVSQGGHGQDLSGFGIHHQTECAVLHIVAINGRCHLLFQAGLNCGIHSQHHTAPGPGADIILIGKGHIHFVIALGGDHPAGLAGEITVVGRLHPLTAGAGEVGKADDLGRQGAVGIDTHGIGLQMNAGDAVFIDECTDLPGSFLIHPAAHLLVAPLQVCCLLADPFRIFLQNFSQNPGNFFNIRPGLFQLMGIQIHILHPPGGGQNVHIPVVDLSPAGAD